MNLSTPAPFIARPTVSVRVAGDTLTQPSSPQPQALKGISSQFSFYFSMELNYKYWIAEMCVWYTAKIGK